MVGLVQFSLRDALWTRTSTRRSFPADGPSYLRLIGGLIAEQERHPELIEAFREHILLRRAIVRALI